MDFAPFPANHKPKYYHGIRRMGGEASHNSRGSHRATRWDPDEKNRAADSVGGRALAPGYGAAAVNY